MIHNLNPILTKEQKRIYTKYLKDKQALVKEIKSKAFAGLTEVLGNAWFKALRMAYNVSRAPLHQKALDIVNAVDKMSINTANAILLQEDGDVRVTKGIKDLVLLDLILFGLKSSGGLF